MEISENQLCHFVETWIKQSQLKILNNDDFVLSDIVHKCFDNPMMFDSWFNGYDVMN